MYRENDLIAIKRMQYDPGMKFSAKYLRPYTETGVLRNNRYFVCKLGEHEEPLQTSNAADCMKPWSNNIDSGDEEDCDDLPEESNDALKIRLSCNRTFGVECKIRMAECSMREVSRSFSNESF